MPSDVNGLLIIDKHARITSAKTVAIVKKLLGVKKVGHAGTLDPLATGVLVCCINKATKLATFLLRGSKKYFAVLRLGIATDTQDSTGAVISTSNNISYAEETIKEVFKKFEGFVEQIPPAYSALKHKGVPLHKLARSGKAVLKPSRRVHISSIKIEKISLPMIYFEVSCSAGTYVRTLCADIGERLGCGGHLKELRRIESSGFSIKDAITLSELETLAKSAQSSTILSKKVINMADALPDIPELIVNEDFEAKILNGNPLTIKDLSFVETDNSNGLLKVVNAKRDLLALLIYDEISDNYNYSCVFHP